MHIQVINFNLRGMSVEEYHKLSDQLSPAFSSIPGLIAKYWLSNSTNNTFGGVYLWQDRAAMEDFTKTELFGSILSHPNLCGICSNEYDVIEEPTRITRGFLQLSGLESQAVSQ